MHGRIVNTTQTHTGHTVSTHFGGHNMSVHSTQTNSLMVTSEWELLLSQPHSPSQHSLPTTHYTLHACTPLSAASHMTTLLGGRSLGWLVGSFAGMLPLHSPTAEWRPQGGRRPPHSLCSPRTTPTRVDQYRRTPHSNWYVCMCVVCVDHWCQSRCYNSQGCGSLGLIQIHRIPCQSVTPGSFTPCGALWVGHFLGGAT